MSDYFRHHFNVIIPRERESWGAASPLTLRIKEKIESKGKPLKDWAIDIYRGILTGYNEAFIVNQETRDRLVSSSPNCAEIIRPILRGRDIEKYNANWGGSYLIVSHTGYTNPRNQKIEPIDINDYPAVKKHLNQYWEQIRDRQDQGLTPYNLRSCIYMDDFFKHKIVWKRIGSVLRFSYDEQGLFCLDSTCFATGADLKFLVGYLNSTVSKRELLSNSPKTGTGDIITSVQALEPLMIPLANQEEKSQISELVNQAIEMLGQNPDADISSIENEIDKVVFKLFEFDKEEIEFIKKS